MNWKQKIMLGAVICGAAVIVLFKEDSAGAMVGVLGSISIALLLYSKSEKK